MTFLRESSDDIDEPSILPNVQLSTVWLYIYKEKPVFKLNFILQ